MLSAATPASTWQVHSGNMGLIGRVTWILRREGETITEHPSLRRPGMEARLRMIDLSPISLLFGRNHRKWAMPHEPTGQEIGPMWNVAARNRFSTKIPTFLIFTSSLFRHSFSFLPPLVPTPRYGPFTSVF
jgi:hypothetical protein